MAGLFSTNPLLGGLSGLSAQQQNTLLGGSAPLPSTLLGLGGLSADPAAAALYPHQWSYVRRRFSRLLGSLAITETQRADARTKQAGVCDCLNRHYWGIPSETANSFLIGSWGKQTQVRPPRDVDLLFLLPAPVYHRFQQREGNRQSSLLQEVKGVLAGKYYQTTMRGDGQVVIVPFSSIPVEVVPGFRCQDGSIIICDTNNGGRYKTSTAEAEAGELAISDLAWGGNTSALVRLMKCWQYERNVPLKSFQFERLAIEFIQTWPHRHQDVFYYDWMVRDFLAYLITRAGGALRMPAVGEIVPLGTDWLSKAESAYKSAITACDHEREGYEALAGSEWQEIFGNAISVLVS